MQASNSSKIDAFTMANNLSFIPSLNAQHFNQYHSLEDVFPNLKASCQICWHILVLPVQKRKAKGRLEGTCLFMTPEVGSWLHPLLRLWSIQELLCGFIGQKSPASNPRISDVPTLGLS